LEIRVRHLDEETSALDIEVNHIKEGPTLLNKDTKNRTAGEETDQIHPDVSLILNITYTITNGPFQILEFYFL